MKVVCNTSPLLLRGHGGWYLHSALNLSAYVPQG
jgi:hypothetical protein